VTRTMTNDLTQELSPLAEEDRAERAWQVNRMLDLGFDVDQVLRLVEAHVSWHAADRLIAAGCPVDLAEWILL